MIIYKELPKNEKDELVREFVETTENLPNPHNYPKTVEKMFLFFLYSKGIEV